jgi:rubredoxin
MAIVRESAITCPYCHHQKTEIMPQDSCQFMYQCENCQQVFRPKAGDCCVFCSYGDIQCPPKQLEASGQEGDI